LIAKTIPALPSLITVLQKIFDA
jgi:hypothetical protein